MKTGQFKLKQWLLKGITVRHLAMPGKMAAAYKWKASENMISLVINLGGMVDLQIEGHPKPINLKPDTCNLFYANSAAGEVFNREKDHVGSSRVDLQACKLEYSIVSPK